MAYIPKHLRARIEKAADELMSIAADLGPERSSVGAVYAAFGAVIKSSHKQESGAHFFTIEIPRNCTVALEVPPHASQKGPTIMIVAKPSILKNASSQ